MSAKAETLGAGVEKNENFNRSRQFNYQNIPWELTKKMNTHILCFVH